MSFIIFDTEYTSWKGCMENGWIEPQKKELVQLAALKVSSDLEVLDKLNLYCKPTFNPILSDYFVALSGIDNDFLQKNGLPFSECYQKFQNFADKDLCLSFAWGRDFSDPSDGRILEENLKFNNIMDVPRMTYRNIAWWFQQVFLKQGQHIQSLNSGKIAKTIGAENELSSLNLNEHNAFYDVYSILIGIRHFKDFRQNLF